MADRVQKLTKAYGVFSLFFLSSLVAFIFFRIDMLSSLNRLRVDSAVSSLGSRLKNHFSFKGCLEDKETSQIINGALDAEPRLLALVLHARDYGIIKTVTKSKDYLINAQYSDFKSPLHFNKTLGRAELNQALNLTYQSHELPLSLSSLYISFSSNDLVTLLSETLFIFLGFFALTVAMLILSALLALPGHPVTENTVKEGPSLKDNQAAFPPGNLDFQAQEKKALATEDRPELFPDMPALSSSEAELELPLDEGELQLEQEIPEAPYEDFFSQSTGLVKGQYFKERLEGELRRASSMGQDLALLIISLERVTAPDFSIKRNLTSVLHRFFPLQELAFEYKGEDIAVIIPDEDTDGALKAATYLYNDLLKEGVETSMGLSTRTFRAVPAEVIIHEAEAAHAKAKQERDHPIIAFKPDPTKYPKT